jgi:hypothetical protein
MNCLYCNCKLRKCKIDTVENREWHYSCYERAVKRQKQQEIKDFLLFFADKGIIVKI